MYFNDELNNFSDDENDSVIDNSEINYEHQYEYKIKLIMQFKTDISFEPEFIGIKNICSQEILDYIENTYTAVKIPRCHKFEVSDEQMRYFKRLYNNLGIDIWNDNIIKTVIYKIFKKIYVLGPK